MTAPASAPPGIEDATPGEWRQMFNPTGYEQAVFAGRTQIASVYGTEEGDVHPAHQAAANARLMASSKELYAALEAAQEELRLIRIKDSGTVYNPVLRTQIAAALARASGAK